MRCHSPAVCGGRRRPPVAVAAAATTAAAVTATAAPAATYNRHRTTPPNPPRPPRRRHGRSRASLTLIGRPGCRTIQRLHRLRRIGVSRHPTKRETARARAVFPIEDDLHVRDAAALCEGLTQIGLGDAVGQISDGAVFHLYYPRCSVGRPSIRGYLGALSRKGDGGKRTEPTKLAGNVIMSMTLVERHPPGESVSSSERAQSMKGNISRRTSAGRGRRVMSGPRGSHAGLIQIAAGLHQLQRGRPTTGREPVAKGSGKLAAGEPVLESRAGWMAGPGRRRLSSARGGLGALNLES